MEKYPIILIKSILFLIISFLLFQGCQAKSVFIKPALEEEGEIFIYIQPFLQEAERLRFSLEGVSAVKEEGMDFPLSISLSEFKGGDMKRQRVIASGVLPPGPYTGLSFKVKSATLKVEDGEAALLVPDEPVRINFPFTIIRQRALLLTLTFKYAESMREGFGFIPFFSISIPGKPVTTLVGYATNYGSNNITVFDKKRGEAVEIIATGRGPKGIAVDQRQRRAYVALSGEDAVEVIDVTTSDVINRIRLNTGDNPQELSLTPDGSTLLVANTGSDTVSIIDPISLIELNRINVGDSPHSVLIDLAGRRAYVFNSLSNAISVIDIPNRSIAATVSTEPGPLRGQFNRKGDRLYVIYEWSPYLTVIDPFSLSVIKRVYVGMGISSIKVDTNTDLLYLGKNRGMEVDIYDPFSFIPLDSMRVKGEVAYITIDGEENNLHLIHHEKKTLTIVNLISRKLVSEIDIGEEPYRVTLMGER